MKSRLGHFAQGATTNTSPTETPALIARAAGFNGQNPRGFTPNGLNQPIMLSPSNGNSTADALRQTPNGELPSQNGMSASTYQKMNPTSYGMSLKI